MDPVIIYQDRDIIVCHKAAGMAVQSRQIGQMDLESQIRNQLAQQDQQDQGECSGNNRNRSSRNSGKGSGRNETQPPYLGVVHRLDQPVEGIVVFARNKKAAADLSAQLTDGRMKKEYLAVCCGAKAEENGQSWISLENWLQKDARTNQSRIVPEKTREAKASRLDYCIENSREADGNRYLLVRIRLHTGRHHQIRVQMAGAGLPLYGDRKYNPCWEEKRTAFLDGETGKCPLALCACRLTLIHPGTGKEMTFHVEPAFAREEIWA